MRDFFRGSRISDTHFPHARIRTPRYDGCFSPPPSRSRARERFSGPPPPRLAPASAGDSGGEDDNVPPDDAGLDTSPSGIANPKRWWQWRAYLYYGTLELNFLALGDHQVYQCL
jgi:hypothetical protein